MDLSVRWAGVLLPSAPSRKKLVTPDQQFLEELIQ